MLPGYRQKKPLEYSTPPYFDSLCLKFMNYVFSAQHFEA